jgi:DNA-directed RNA polymerase subunit M/transcription elongation factor TFIIS
MDHPLRDYTRAQFESHLSSGALARNCERSVLNWAVKKFPKYQASWDNSRFKFVYKHKVHSLLAELKRSPSTKIKLGLSVVGDQVKVKFDFVPELPYRLKNKELESAKFATYSPDILWPDGPYSSSIFNARKLDMDREARKTAADEDYVGILTCGKCRSNKGTSYYQMQTRSADEPMVRYYSCLLFKQLLTPLLDNLCKLQVWPQVEVLKNMRNIGYRRWFLLL